MSGSNKADVLTATKSRTVDTALELFSAHGVSGTSLQMIAEQLGVTKAAIYHQFKSKDEIVIAVTETIMGPLEAASLRAEAQPTPQKRRQSLVGDLVDQAVKQRKVAGLLQRDPYIGKLFSEYDRFSHIMGLMNSLLVGPKDIAEARVTAALILTSIGGTVMHPMVAEVDDETLRNQLWDLADGLVRKLNKL